MTHPWAEFTDAHIVNPPGKVPTLIFEDGSALYDSAVICEYLDTVHDEPKMFPASGDVRWTALRQQTLGDGIVGAGGDALREERRVEHERSPGWMVRQMGVVDHCLDALELEASIFDGMNIGLIAIGSGLGFLDFRHPTRLANNEAQSYNVVLRGFPAVLVQKHRAMGMDSRRRRAHEYLDRLASRRRELIPIVCRPTRSSATPSA